MYFVTLRNEMLTSTPAGRPRDGQIDQAVLRATVELVEEVGYLQLTIAAIAERAGTTKPAIYRRWPTKAHLVHEAVFPAQDLAERAPSVDLRDDIRILVRVALELLGRPAARAALPGLMAETAADGTLATEVLAHAAAGTFDWLRDRLAAGVANGEVRRGVATETVFELVAGAAFMATATRPSKAIGKKWIDDIVELIVRGIAPLPTESKRGKR